MGIRERIIENAERKGFDYKRLAQCSGLPRPTVHRYLNGKNDLTGCRLDKLFAVLGLDVGRRRRTKDEMRPPEAIFINPVAGSKPLFRYPGSKWRLMPDLVRLMPRHQHYVVLFGGSGADILRKPPSPLETFNDLDGGVYNLYKVLQDDDLLARLKRRLASTPAQSQRHYEEALDALTNGADPVDKAWAFLVASFQGFCLVSPSAQTANHWRTARRPHTTAKAWMKLPDTIDLAASRFRFVQLSNLSWQEVLVKTDARTTLFLADPPYHPDTLPRAYYRHSMTSNEHEALLDALITAKGLVMLHGYDNDCYNDRLGHWRRIEFDKQASLNPVGGRQARTEVLWLNYDANGKKLRRTGGI